MARPKGGGGDAREKLIGGIGRGFRTGGYGGIGVDGLAREAGLTSGAFYAHFGSKAEAFTIAVREGLTVLHGGIAMFQAEHGEAWLAPFIDFYLGPRMEVDLNEACALPTFSADVARGSGETRAAYTQAMQAIAALVASGLDGADRHGPRRRRPRREDGDPGGREGRGEGGLGADTDQVAARPQSVNGRKLPKLTAARTRSTVGEKSIRSWVSPRPLRRAR